MIKLTTEETWRKSTWYETEPQFFPSEAVEHGNTEAHHVRKQNGK